MVYLIAYFWEPTYSFWVCWICITISWKRLSNYRWNPIQTYLRLVPHGELRASRQRSYPPNVFERGYLPSAGFPTASLCRHIVLSKVSNKTRWERTSWVFGRLLVPNLVGLPGDDPGTNGLCIPLQFSLPQSERHLSSQGYLRVGFHQTSWGLSPPTVFVVWTISSPSVTCLRAIAIIISITYLFVTNPILASLLFPIMEQLPLGASCLVSTPS